MKKLFTIATLSLMIGLVSCSNPFEKKKKDNTPLLLGLAVLANQPSYEATVTIVGFLQQPDNKPIRDGRVEIKNVENQPEYLVPNQGEIKEFTKCQTSSPLPMNDINLTRQDGQFTITFKVNSEKGKVKLHAIRHKDGETNNTKGCSTIADFQTADYTLNVGTAVFNLNIKNNNDKDSQIQVTDEQGLKIYIKEITTVVKGTYNLQNPTVGENICDGKNVTGTPEVISGNIQGNKTISGAAQLQGTVYVTNGATLTVEAGTVVFGNRGSSLFVLPGGKLITKGNKNNPVCFTSAQAPGSRFPGDWGGIVIIGNGKGTRGATTEGTTPQPYGTGTDDADNSGSLEYTIIEFAGNEVAPGDELNALSLYAVGSGTKIEHVQVHRGLDDGFEAWGGAVNMKYLVATGGLDDDYDLDEGYTGNIEYIIGHKYPASCGGSPSTDPHGFEMDGIHSGAGTNCSAPTNTNGGQANRCTNPNINYFTMLGGGANNSSFSTASEAARLREGFAGNIDNGIFFGYEVSNAANYINGATSGTFPANTWKVLNNVYADQGKSCNQNGGTCSLSFTLTSLPIASVGNVPDCGFGANKPDYTTNTASGAPASVGASGGSAPAKWWEGWTVYRAR